MRSRTFLFACLLLSSVSQARIITVEDDGPADFHTIQAAIDDANDGDTVIISPGTYTGDGNRDIDFGGKSIAVRSTDPNDPNIVAATVIDCRGSETEPHCGFYLDGCDDAEIRGLTIVGGYSPNPSKGVRIDSRHTTMSVVDCMFTENALSSIHCCHSQLKLARCTFQDNGADRAYGGGV